YNRYDHAEPSDAYFGWGKPLPFSQVYATLARLDRDGKVVVEEVEPGAGRSPIPEPCRDRPPDAAQAPRRTYCTRVGHSRTAAWMAATKGSSRRWVSAGSCAKGTIDGAWGFRSHSQADHAS